MSQVFSKLRSKFRRSTKDPAAAVPSPVPTTTSRPPRQPRINPGTQLQLAVNSAATATTAPTTAPTPVASAAASSPCSPPSLPGTNPGIAQPFTADPAITTTATTPASITTSQNSPSPRTSPLWEKAVDILRDEGGEDSDWGKGYDIQLVPDLINEIKKKKKECDGKRWFYINSQGKKVFYVETLLEQLNKYAMVGDIAIQHHPDIAALAWSGFRLLLQVGTAYTDNMRAVSERLEYLVRIIYCCDIYERLYSSDLEIAELLSTSIVNLYASILRYLSYAKGYLEKNTGARVLGSLFSDMGPFEKVRGFEKDVEDYVGMAEKEAAAKERSDQGKRTEDLKKHLDGIKEPIQNIERVVEDILTFVERERRLKILEWLSDVQFSDHHSFLNERRHRNTGHWLLENEKYLVWKLSDSSSIIWLRGDAGSGKTMLASRVIDEFRDQVKGKQHVLAYFYCHYTQEKRNDPESILRALVKQLCLANMGLSFPEPVLSIYEEREKQGHSSGPLKLSESKHLIINSSKGFMHTTIVIDGLDECNRDTRRGLFCALNDIVSSTKRVKIFVTGRNDKDIQEMLADSPSHYINATDNTKDINIYINSEIDRRCNPRFEGGRPLLEGKVDPTLKKKIISTLESKAKGMFMWVHFQILAICEEHTPANVEKALDKLPKDLGTTYAQILKRIDSQSETSSSVAKRVLGWLLYAQEPCSLETIIQAFAVKPGGAALDTDELEWTLPDILSICQNLVVYDEKLKSLRYAHLSVQEFLQRQPEFSQKEKAHSDMAEVCLTVLTDHHSEAKSCSIPALLRYSTFNWAAHVRLSGGSNAFEWLLKDFLKPTPAYKAWGSKVTARDEYLRGKESQVVPPLWAACYYQLYDISIFLLRNGADPNPCNKTMQTPLLRAAVDGHKEIVQMLLEKDGVDVNCKAEYGLTPLLWAAVRDNKEIVQMLLEKDGVDVNCKAEDGKTPLLWAAVRDNKEIVQMLLEKDGVDVNCKAEDGLTPLLCAAVRGNKEIVQMLLEKDGIDVNCKAEDGLTPLLCAAVRDNKEIVQMLLEKDGIDVNCKAEDGKTLLLCAAVRDNKEIVQMLLEKDGIDVNCKAEDGKTPLLWAAVRDNKEIVQMLLEKDGIDVNCKAEDGLTPLLWAAVRGNKEIVQMLLEKDGIDVNCKAEDGKTPLLWAAVRDNKEIVQMLLEKDGVDANCNDEDGKTPLLCAAAGGHKEIVQMLLEKDGVDANCKAEDGKAPLLCAAAGGHKEIVQMLLEKDGIDVNCKGGGGETPLLYATVGGHKEIVQMLLEKGGVDVNCKGGYGATPLLCAAVGGHKEIVQVLLEKDGIDVNCKGENGETPLSLATRGGHKEIAQMLLEKDRVEH